MNAEGVPRIGPDYAAMVQGMSHKELAELTGVLARDSDENGCTGELLGHCLYEAVGRLGKISEEK